MTEMSPEVREALEKFAELFERFAKNIVNNNPNLIEMWDGRAEGYHAAAQHLRGEIAAWEDPNRVGMLEKRDDEQS